MKTARFTEVVKRCGAPETHLVLIQPEKDKELQKAIKAHRVMTVFQKSAGSQTDSGAVGFEQGGERQYLIFPKSLRAFEGRKIVGIKYDLLSTRELPKSEQARRPKPPKKKKKPALKIAKPDSTPATAKPEVEAFKSHPKKGSKPSRPSSTSTTAKKAPSKVIKFHLPDRDDDSKESGKSDSKALQQMKRLARQAMHALEQGKQVAAFNLLKRIATA